MPERRAHAVEIAFDRDIIGRNLLTLGIEEHDVGLADCGADDVGALRRANHGVGDLGIGDQHVLDVARQIENHRLADAKRQKARPRLSDNAVFTRSHGGQRRIERQRGDDRE